MKLLLITLLLSLSLITTAQRFIQYGNPPYRNITFQRVVSSGGGGGGSSGIDFRSEAPEDFYVFNSWAVLGGGDSTTDVTSALQAAIDTIQGKTLYLPAGTYRITSTLNIVGKKDFNIIGAHPDSVRIIWGGASGGKMFYINGSAYFKMQRLTLDCKNVGYYCIDQSWDGQYVSGKTFDTGIEYADIYFLNTQHGILGGTLGHGFAETAIRRCKFINNNTAGISLGNYNALDIWIWHCYFENNYRGITNVFGAGNFKVFYSVFENSTDADISTANTGEFAFRYNYSRNSNMFLKQTFSGNPSQTLIQGNVIVEPEQAIAIQLSNQGPISLLDNIIVKDGVVTAPIVHHNAWPNGHIFALDNTFPVASAIEGNILIETNSTVASTDYNPPTLPTAPPRGNLTIRDVPAGATTSEIQALINLGGVIHFTGQHFINATLDIPNGVVICGDTHGDNAPTRIEKTGGGKALNILGDDVLIKDIAIKSGGIYIAKDTVYLQQADFRGNTNNLWVKDAALRGYNCGFSGSTTSVYSDGDVILFAGASSDNALSYNVDGKLVVKDYWYESSTFGRYMINTGTATIDGCHVAYTGGSNPSTNSGTLTFFNVGLVNTISTSGTFLGLGVMNEQETYFTSTGGDARSFNCRVRDPNSATSGSGSNALANIGTYDAAWVEDKLQAVRTHFDSPHGVRFERVWISNCDTGMVVRGTNPIAMRTENQRVDRMSLARAGELREIKNY